MPVHVLQRERKIGRAERELAAELGRQPTDEEIAEAAELPLKQVREVRDAARAVTSLDRPVGENEDTSLGDLSERRGRARSRRSRSSLRKEIVRRAVSELPEREREVVRASIRPDGDQPPKSIEEVVRTARLLASRVRRIEHGALARLGQTREIEALRDVA